MMVRASVLKSQPAASATWRAGDCPRPAEMTLPMMHSSTAVALRPARSSAPLAATAPSCTALIVFSVPLMLAMGVRAALQMYTS